MGSDECAVLIGGGCSGRRARDPCEEETGAGSSETGCEDCGNAEWVGGGRSCETAPGGLAPLVMLLLLFLARTAFAVDVEHLGLGESGAVPGIADPGMDAPWTSRVTVGASMSRSPVRLRTDAATVALVDELDTLEVGATLMIADWFRAGVVVPGHLVWVAGESRTSGVGNLGISMTAPLGERTAATTSVEFPFSGSPEFARQASVTAGVAGTRDAAVFTLAGQARARFQRAQDLPGVRWGPRLELAAGARTRGFAGVGVSALVGAPLTLVLSPAPGAWPVEGHAFGALRLSPGVDLEAGAGAGLTWGLGSPSSRVFAVLRVGGKASDRDGDRIRDLVDACRDRPEDRDGFHDRGGCPEPDNDRDGFLDPADACPLVAEVVNGLADDDGCPDEMGRWRIVVLPEGEAEQVRIAIDGEGGWQLETRAEHVVVPGRHHVRVEVPGHQPFEAAIDVPPGVSELEVPLGALRFGELRIALSDPDGRPLAGRVELGPDLLDVPGGGVTVVVASGARHGTASAPGHAPEAVRVLVAPEALSTLDVVLEPVAVSVEKPAVLFQHDAAGLTGEAVGLLDTLAGWLRDHPEVLLLRIDGHADALGSPAYNYALSVRRAAAVRDALVARGIAAERLDPVGSGEARAHLVPDASPPALSMEVAGVPARDVTFRVLVWEEGATVAMP